jgi:hypothetical protein
MARSPPGEAASLSQLVANTAKAVETFELADRLAKLEEQMTAKGSIREDERVDEVRRDALQAA